MANGPTYPVKVIKDFFGMSLSEMKKEWIGKDGDWTETDLKKRLTDKDKEQIAEGLVNGSLTY